MQKLEKRTLKNTPTDISHVRSNCGLSLKSPEGRDSVADLKTFSNTPDAILTAGLAGQNSRVSVVNVYLLDGELCRLPFKKTLTLKGGATIPPAP